LTPAWRYHRLLLDNSSESVATTYTIARLLVWQVLQLPWSRIILIAPQEALAVRITAVGTIASSGIGGYYGAYWSALMGPQAQMGPRALASLIGLIGTFHSCIAPRVE